MRQRILVSALGVGALAVAGLTVQTLSAAGADAATPYTAGKHAARVCSTAKAKHTASCDAVKLVNPDGFAPAASAPPSTGLTPTGLRDAYKLNGLSAGGRTVAIVDAYGRWDHEQQRGHGREQEGRGQRERRRPQ